MGKTSTRSKNAWDGRNYDRVTILVKKGEKERLSLAAAREGVSVSRFIVDSVNARCPGLLAVLSDTSKAKKAPETGPSA